MRRVLFFLMLGTVLWGEPDSLIPPDPHTVNGFTLSNPGYRYRAATSYEQNYFPQALTQLHDRTYIPKPALRKILQGFTYRWLDRYVIRGGFMPQADLLETVGWLDGQFRQNFSAGEFAGYQLWRDSPDNPLNFLFHAIPLKE